MDILKTLSLKSNRQININFDGGDLSSDAEGLSNRLENTILGILMIFFWDAYCQAVAGIIRK